MAGVRRSLGTENGDLSTAIDCAVQPAATETDTITAVYSGDQSFLGSASAPLIEQITEGTLPTLILSGIRTPGRIPLT